MWWAFAPPIFSNRHHGAAWIFASGPGFCNRQARNNGGSIELQCLYWRCLHRWGSCWSYQRLPSAPRYDRPFWASTQTRRNSRNRGSKSAASGGLRPRHPLLYWRDQRRQRLRKERRCTERATWGSQGSQHLELGKHCHSIRASLGSRY